MAIYPVALSAFRCRSLGRWNRNRLIAAALIALVMPLALALAAWVTLAAVAAITRALVSFETIRYAELRRRARRGQLA